MQVLPQLLILLAVLFLIICFILILFPSFFAPINLYLANYSHIIGFFGSIFTAFAVLVASLAYKNAILRPKLRLIVRNEVDEALRLGINEEGLFSSNPYNTWRFFLENYGEAVAKYPVVQILFNGAYLKKKTWPGDGYRPIMLTGQDGMAFDGRRETDWWFTRGFRLSCRR